MAAANPVQSLQVEATCPICLEYYKDSVITKCGHNFCRSCINGCSQGSGSGLRCPQCRAVCPQGDLRPNRRLQSMVELVKQLSLQSGRAPGEGLCEEHEQKLKLFCEEDGKLICVTCRESSSHRSHTMYPTKEAAVKYKDVRSTLSRCESVKLTSEKFEDGIKKYKEHVTLDEDTANGWLDLSEGGRRVTLTRSRGSPPRDHPWRFTASAFVLGRGGFSSGRHYWEVQLLQDGHGWSVGVARESVSRKERVRESPEWGVWALERRYNATYWALTAPPTPLFIRHCPLKLGVYLDYEGGLLSFYNADTGEPLYTFTSAAFTGALHPHFWLGHRTDLRLV